MESQVFILLLPLSLSIFEGDLQYFVVEIFMNVLCGMKFQLFPDTYLMAYKGWIKHGKTQNWS